MRLTNAEGNTRGWGGSTPRGTRALPIPSSRLARRRSRRSCGSSGETFVYRPFRLVYFVHVSDRDQAEGHVHQALAASRVNPAKEFFEVPIMTVIRALDEAASYWPIQLGRNPAFRLSGTRVETASGHVSAVRREDEGASPAHQRPRDLQALLRRIRVGFRRSRIVAGPDGALRGR